MTTEIKPTTNDADLSAFVRKTIGKTKTGEKWVNFAFSDESDKKMLRNVLNVVANATNQRNAKQICFDAMVTYGLIAKYKPQLLTNKSELVNAIKHI